MNKDFVSENKDYNFYKKNENDIIWWVEKNDAIGEYLFTFDKKKIFNLFRDYPYQLTQEEKEIFDKENSYWADFFKDRDTKIEKTNLGNDNKQVVFDIIMSNWGMIGPNSITGNEFIIYDDLSIELKVSQNNSLGTKKEVSTLHGLISQEEYEEIVSNIKKAKPITSTVEAVDGNAFI